MNRLLIFFSILLFCFGATSQTIKVIDQTNLQPIEDVLIIDLNNSKTALTNQFGITEISSFNKNDTVIFQHPSYQQFILSYAEIINSDKIIKLKARTIHLSQIVVSASKWEQDRTEVPNKITFITAREISFNNSQTSADLLGASGEVFVQKSQLGGGSPMIRGFAANTVLLVVDGVRMNNLIYRSGNLQNIINLDVNIIESAEVIFGPGSVMYGSDAMGGVMDLHTKSPQLSYDSKYQVSANALLRYSTANNENMGHVDFNVATSKWGFLTSFTYSSFNDLRMGSHNHDEYQRLQYVETNNGNDTILENDNPDIQVFSGYNQLNLMQKVRFRPNDKIDIDYGFHYSNTSDIPRYDRLTQYSNNKLKYAAWYYGPQRWMLNALNVKVSDTNRLFDKVKLTAAYQNYEESRHDRKLDKSSINERFENVNVYSFNLDFDKSLKANTHFFYGIELFFNTNKSTAHARDILTSSLSPLETRYPDGINRQLIVAPYFSYKNNISEKVTLLTGIRYNYIWLYSTFVDTSFYQFSPVPLDNKNSAFNGSLGFVFRPTGSWQINLNLSSGFHAPNLDGLAKVFQPSSGNVLVPNSNLKPEYSYNMDVGIMKNFNSIASIEATLFYSRVVDPLVTQDYLYNGENWIIFDGDTNNVIAVVNAGHADIFGGNLTFKADLTDFLSFRSYICLMKGFYDNDEPLRHVSPLFGSTYLTYNTTKTRLEIYAIYNGEISHENLAFAERDKPYMYATDNNGNLYSPGWWTLNFMGSYQINRYLQVNFGLENILDKRYRPYSSGICAPGRNFIFALRVKL